jgi:hypothetical protein
MHHHIPRPYGVGRGGRGGVENAVVAVGILLRSTSPDCAGGQPGMTAGWTAKMEVLSGLVDPTLERFAPIG